MTIKTHIKLPDGDTIENLVLSSFAVVWGAVVLFAAWYAFTISTRATCVRQFGERGELIQQWTTDGGAQTALTGWSFSVRGEMVGATGNLVEFPGVCPEAQP